MPSNSDPAALGASSKPPTIPESIRAAQEEAQEKAEQNRKDRDEIKRLSPVIVAYREIYKDPGSVVGFVIGLDAAADDAWWRGFAQRLVQFSKTASDAGYAKNIRALTVNNYPDVRARADTKSKRWISIAMDLVKAALSEDEDGVLALIQACPPDERWDVVFNTRPLLDQILAPHVSASGKAMRKDSSIAIPEDGTDKSAKAGVEGAQQGIPRIEAADEQASDSGVERLNANESTLCERGKLVLTVLLRNQAFDSDRLQTTTFITAKATGPSADPNGFKHVISKLKSLRLIETKEGRGGGCWLTPKGRLRAEKINRKL
jgi:hypothetical protein